MASRTELQQRQLNSRLRSAIESELLDSVRKAIALGADVNEENRSSTPLQWAYKSSQIVAELLNAGANPNQISEGQVPVLLLAAADCANETIRLVLAAGGEPNIRDGEALLLSTRNNNLAAVQMLLNSGCDPNSTGVWRNNFPLAEASSGTEFDESVLQTHPMYYRKYHEIQKSAKGKRGAALMRERGLQELIEQASQDRLEIIEALLQSGANIDFQISLYERIASGTALHEAISAGNASEALLLLVRGASLTAKNEAGVTAGTLLASSHIKDLILKSLTQQDNT